MYHKILVTRTKVVRLAAYQDTLEQLDGNRDTSAGGGAAQPEYLPPTSSGLPTIYIIVPFNHPTYLRALF